MPTGHISGQDALRDADDVLAILGDDIDAVVAGDLGGLDKPTQIIDAGSGKILRG